ncbi:MAG TPA: divalent-cation tolerance protein CutA [Pedomonas sp.]|uniref:divalent-cation tolerance protein CutA n=1 Tax=Pedomonas sp. TaxID=2976421 RepID=UPI002F3F46ED
MSSAPETGPETDVVSVYVTFPADFAVEEAVTALVREKLAACGNLMTGATSLYSWEGRIERDAETIAIFKTTADRIEALVARLREIHPYDTPCIVAWPVIGGFGPYLEWVKTETRF